MAYSVQQEFLDRLGHLPFHGMGLSVDVYSPDLLDLCDALQKSHLAFDYLEIFQAPPSVLHHVRSQLTAPFLEYHADGLWVTQPRMTEISAFEQEVTRTAQHLTALESMWITQECASKQLGGYLFGTYLPPLFTARNISVIADNVRMVQGELDRLCQHHSDSRYGPLFLLETPPLTYFAFGDISYPEFFRAIVETCSCGLVLDIGHVWTVFRYARRQPQQQVNSFFKDFLDVFPLERVVQIHLAGLGPHPTDSPSPAEQDPEWIDAHDQPIPGFLWDLLEQILDNPRLVSLKGMALEVDTKPVELTTEEFSHFLSRCGGWASRIDHPAPPLSSNRLAHPHTFDARTQYQPANHLQLAKDYEQYVQAVLTPQTPPLPVLGDPWLNTNHQLPHYREAYLPYEILYWGGDLREMFPHTLGQWQTGAYPLQAFVDFWFHKPQTLTVPYDFFLLKIERFVQFTKEHMPSAQKTVEQEARQLREAYLMATEREQSAAS